MTKRQLLLLIVTGTALLGLSCRPSNTIYIHGVGATFPAPLYERWFHEYYRAHPDVEVNYLRTGSGAGVTKLRDEPVDFAATDEPLTKERLEELSARLSDRERQKVELMQIPLTSGAIGLCYNLPGNPPLKLSRKAYVEIALGEIRFWDDAAIQAANPDVPLPHLPITFVHRSDSGGTTFVFTNHLNAIDDRWKPGKDRKPDSPWLNAPDGPGASKTPKWVVGVGGNGNAGVATTISHTSGAFGYLEVNYAQWASLKMAAIENRLGEYVEPTPEGCRIALEEAEFNDVFGATIPDPKGKNAYPIVGFTWVLVRKHYNSQPLGHELKRILLFCLQDEEGKGQDLSEEMGYVKLPKEILERARAASLQINADTENRASN